jgi:predicted amidophosphoribosyltransferase
MSACPRCGRRGPHTCYGCGAPVEDAPGVYYCDDCIARQLAENGGTEREVFDAYHRWADRQGGIG